MAVFENVLMFWIRAARNDNEGVRSSQKLLNSTGPITPIHTIISTKSVNFQIIHLEMGVVPFLSSRYFEAVPFWIRLPGA